MNSNIPASTIADARRALTALQPHLPEPRLSEWMHPHGIVMPQHDLFGEPDVLPIIVEPTTLLNELGPYAVDCLPKRWLSAHAVHKRRWQRTTQLLKFHAECLRAETGAASIPDLSHCDGIVAGVLLLLVRPRLGKLRNALVKIACTHPFGAFISAHVMLVEDEHQQVLGAIGHDTRLASSLCRYDSVAADGLPKNLSEHHDIWSATVALVGSNADAWLEGALAHATADPVAATMALTLLPNAADSQHQKWLRVVAANACRFSYETARWCQHTWSQARWFALRDQLKASAISDLGRFHFLWYRDIQRESAHEALQSENLDFLWAAELTHAVRNPGHILRRQCNLRIKTNPADVEAKLTLRWLNQRSQPISI